MKAEQYLNRTRTAVEHLFTAIDEYDKMLSKAKVVARVFHATDEEELEREREQWLINSADDIKARMAVEREWLSESFARSMLAGSILQIAEKAIELFSKDRTLPTDFSDEVFRKFSRYAVGRRVRDVPIGFIIYAGRNQFAHFNDAALKPVSREIFARLAEQQSDCGSTYIDPGLDLESRTVECYSSNILHILEWTGYERYLSDMRSVTVA